MDTLQRSWTNIYMNKSKIDNVGDGLTWQEEEKEKKSLVYTLHPSRVVF